MTLKEMATQEQGSQGTQQSHSMTKRAVVSSFIFHFPPGQPTKPSVALFKRSEKVRTYRYDATFRPNHSWYHYSNRTLPIVITLPLSPVASIPMIPTLSQRRGVNCAKKPPSPHRISASGAPASHSPSATRPSVENGPFTRSLSVSKIPQKGDRGRRLSALTGNMKGGNGTILARCSKTKA